MKNFDGQKIVEDLLSQHWEYVYFFADNPDAMWEIWKELFLDILNRHAPIQQKKVRSNKVPWITSEIKKLINKRDKFKRKAIVKNLEADWVVYKQTRNKVNIEIRKAKNDYYSNRIAGQKHNPRVLENNKQPTRQTKQTNKSK